MKTMNKQQRAKPILRWPGGKARMLKHLLPIIPPHVCYCEVFTGGGALFFAKERSQVEVINDLNGDLISLYLNVQKHLPELFRQVEMAVTSRQLFHLYGKQPGLTDIERSVRFLLRNRTSFGGNMHSFGVAKTPGGGVAVDREKLKDWINAAHARLDNVVIENIPYERCFKNYDSKDTLFFLDPPYLKSKVDAYDGFSKDDLRKFRREVGQLKGKWIVTLDDCQFNRDLFNGCNIKPVSTQNRSVNVRTHAKETFGEIIITPN
jgi:DNA adenine methylase